MKKYYENFDDYCQPRRSNHYGLELCPARSESINDLIEHQALMVLIARGLKAQIKTAKAYSRNFCDFVLTNNTFLIQLQKFHDQLFPLTAETSQRSIQGKRVVQPAASKIISLYMHIFSTKGISNFDRVLGLNLIRQITTCYGRMDYVFNPSDNHDTSPLAVKHIPVKVKDFQGSGILRMKIEQPELCHSLEPFVILKDEINKIESGLWEKLSKVIDRLLACNTHASFFEEALIFLASVEHHVVPNVIITGEFDEFGDYPMPKLDEEKPAQTLLTKFRLDCNCQTYVDDWKLQCLPILINNIFNMKAA